MGCGLNLCRTSRDGVGFTLRLPAHSSKRSPMASLGASNSAGITIAAGFSTTRQKEKPAAGAAAKAAATANASAVPGPALPASCLLGPIACRYCLRYAHSSCWREPTNFLKNSSEAMPTQILSFQEWYNFSSAWLSGTRQGQPAQFFGAMVSRKSSIATWFWQSASLTR